MNDIELANDTGLAGAAPRTGPPQPASFLVGTGTGPGNVAQRGPRHPTARH